MVNVSPENTGWLAGYDPAAYLPATWHGCVGARSDLSRDLTDEPPTVARFVPFIWPKNFDGGGATPFNRWETMSGSEFRNTVPDLTTLSAGPNSGCLPPITPLIHRLDTLRGALARTEEVAGSGGTNLAHGLAWGWRTLSPRWSGHWRASPSGRPSPIARKSLILLTDGINEWNHNTDRGGLNVTGFGPPEANLLGLPYDPARKSEEAYRLRFAEAATVEMDRRTLEVCGRIKGDGVTIYTIGFAVAGTPEKVASVKTVLRQCASAPDQFHEASDEASLTRVYDRIAEQIRGANVVRLVQ